MSTAYKRLVVPILFVSIVLFCCACANAGHEHLLNIETIQETERPTETTEPISDNPLIAAEFQRAPIYNGSGTKMLGMYAYIKIDKLVLEQITLEEYTEFCETVVDSSIYNWVSIICDDWTGIQFTGSQYIIATYGKINYEGIITEDIGYITQTENGFEYKNVEAETIAAD